MRRKGTPGGKTPRKRTWRTSSPTRCRKARCFRWTACGSGAGRGSWRGGGLPCPFTANTRRAFFGPGGRAAGARRKFLEIAESEARPATAERARYLAAWISEEEEDLETATEQFGKLAGARDEQGRQEAVVRRACA